MALNGRQESFAVNVVKNGGDKVKARSDAGYSTKMSMPSQGKEADTLYNHPKIHPRIVELQKIASVIANEKFTVTIEQRVKWLQEVAEAGLTKQTITKGEDTIEQRENLPAVTGAIRVLNEMLGTDEQSDKVKPVKVFIGVEDAS